MSAKRKKEMVLIRDVVIPAGTRLSRAPDQVSYHSEHYEALIGFGDDNTASLVISPDDLSEGIMTELL